LTARDKRWAQAAAAKQVLTLIKGKPPEDGGSSEQSR